MAQTVCVLLDATDAARLAVIASDRARPLKHIQRVRMVLLSAERLSFQDVARWVCRAVTKPSTGASAGC